MACEINPICKVIFHESEAIRGRLMSGDEALKYEFRVFRPCVNIIYRH